MVDRINPSALEETAAVEAEVDASLQDDFDDDPPIFQRGTPSTPPPYPLTPPRSTFTWKKSRRNFIVDFSDGA